MMFLTLFALVWAKESLAAEASPVSKVITLLKDMQNQLETEKKEDEQLYDQLACWCENNKNGKATAVETATKRIAALESDMKRLTSKSAELEETLASLAQETSDNQQALDQATNIRKKDAAEFNGDENDLISSVQSVTNAVTVLSKHHESFLQMPSVLLSVKSSLAKVMKNDDLIAQILGSDDKKTVTEFVQSGEGYAPASGQIFGVLKQMKTNFESNLEDSRNDEAKALKDYASLKEAKTSEIEAGQQQTKEKKQELAKTKEELAQATQDHGDMSAALDADQKFVKEMTEKCSVTDTEWEERSKTRQAEIQAVGETIGILADDDAHDVMASSLGFVQLTSSLSQDRRAKAAAVLRAVPNGGVALVSLASRVKLDSFEKVKAEITKMVDTLKTEMADEKEHKDFCNKALQENEMEAYAKKNEMEDLDVKVNAAAAAMEQFAKEIKGLQASITDLHVELKRAAENRIKENKEFQQTVADQRASQVILKKAMDRLSKFYGASLMQVRADPTPGAKAEPMPQGFDTYKKNQGSGSVMTMIENIIVDSKELEAEAIKSEQDAEAAYHAFVGDSNNALDKAARSMTDKQEEKAKTETAKAGFTSDRASAGDQKQALASEREQLHASCDFVMKNFDARQAARGQEIEGLQQASQILSGANIG